MPRSYAASNYDDDACLKPPLLLWIAAIYLSRAIALPLAWGIGSVAGITPESISLLHRMWSYQALLAAAIAAPMLYALCRRAPGASQPVRWIWARGRAFLAAAAAVDLAVSLISVIKVPGFGAPGFMPLFFVAIDAYFLLYILTARRVRDTFSDFPPPLNRGSA
jgi:hypothetical protein